MLHSHYAITVHLCQLSTVQAAKRPTNTESHHEHNINSKNMHNSVLMQFYYKISCYVFPATYAAILREV